MELQRTLWSGIKQMNTVIYDTIVKNKELINNNQFQELYNQLYDSKNTAELTKVLLEAGINPAPYFNKRIPSFCFYDTDLTNIELNSSCSQIGDYSFYEAAVKNIDLKNINQIGISSFERCKVEHLDIGNCIIRDSAFRYCNRLKSLDCKDVVIQQSGFAKCTSLTDVKVSSVGPGSGWLGKFAFSGCSQLKNINLEYFSQFGNRALQGTAIEEVTLGNECIHVDSNVFKNCKQLKKITCLSGKTNLNKDTFWTDEQQLTIVCLRNSEVHDQLNSMNNPFISIEFI